MHTPTSRRARLGAYLGFALECLRFPFADSNTWDLVEVRFPGRTPDPSGKKSFKAKSRTFPLARGARGVSFFEHRLIAVPAEFRGGWGRVRLIGTRRPDVQKPTFLYQAPGLPEMPVEVKLIRLSEVRRMRRERAASPLSRRRDAFDALECRAPS